MDSGGRIISLPATSGARGYSANVILDEFAYHDNPEKVWDAASAAVTHGGFRLRILSTPNGVGNMFYDMCTDPVKSAGYTHHRVTVDEAVAQGLIHDRDAAWRQARNDPRVYEQLFCCSFLDGDLQYIPTSLVEDAVDTSRPRFHGPVYAGFDFGLENDLTALTIVRQDAEGICWEQETRTCRRTSWDDQLEMILASSDDWGWRTLAVDATGMGAVPAQLLQKALGRNRVLPVTFTMQSKEALATGMYQRFADRTVRILGDEDMVRDLCSIRRMITAAGNVRYDAPRTEQGHADCAWSLALALHCASPLAVQGGRVDYGDGDFA
jgi:phage FluMu gp28-like protein